jgi:hypothetical protein
MDHLPKQDMQQSTQQRRYGFQPGVSGNPAGRPSAAAKRAMIESTARDLGEGMFDRLSARDRVLLLQAAALLVGRPRNNEDMVRRTNAVTRLLVHVRGLRAAPPSAPSFADEVASPSLSDLMSGHR